MYVKTKKMYLNFETRESETVEYLSSTTVHGNRRYTAVLY